jgi:hypothetical protein
MDFDFSRGFSVGRTGDVLIAVFIEFDEHLAELSMFDVEGRDGNIFDIQSADANADEVFDVDCICMMAAIIEAVDCCRAKVIVLVIAVVILSSMLVKGS